MPKRKSARMTAPATLPEPALPEAEPKGPNFMDLPLELRIETYKHLKKPRQSWRPSPLYPRKLTRQTRNQKVAKNKSPSFASSHSFLVNILLLNTAIHAEASDTLYRNMDWHFFVTGTNEGERRKPELLEYPVFHYITQVTLGLTNTWRLSVNGGDAYYICKMFAEISNLKQLNITFPHLYDLDYFVDIRCFQKLVSTLPKHCNWTLLLPREMAHNEAARQRMLQRQKALHDRLKKSSGMEMALKMVDRPVYMPIYGYYG